MSTIIWCDRVKHEVTAPKDVVRDLIDTVLFDLTRDFDLTKDDPSRLSPRGFAFFEDTDGRELVLDVQRISSFYDNNQDRWPSH
jgi:hypothetical protein